MNRRINKQINIKIGKGSLFTANRRRWHHHEIASATYLHVYRVLIGRLCRVFNVHGF